MTEVLKNITIVQAHANDIELLQKLSIVTFTDTFAAYNTAENMRMYIEKYLSVENLLEELNNSENFFFIAFQENEPAGYLKLRLPQENVRALKDSKSIELERIYVVKKLQGSGLGYKLMQFAFDYSRQKGFDTLWLGVWERNEKAIRFYEKFGFEIFGEHEFILGTDKQNDLLMKKALAT
jgi:ribosomal protein S18 acetylase RimI-like enzyme